MLRENRKSEPFEPEPDAACMHRGRITRRDLERPAEKVLVIVERADGQGLRLVRQHGTNLVLQLERCLKRRLHREVLNEERVCRRLY